MNSSICLNGQAAIRPCFSSVARRRLKASTSPSAVKPMGSQNPKGACGQASCLRRARLQLASWRGSRQGSAGPYRVHPGKDLSGARLHAELILKGANDHLHSMHFAGCPPVHLEPLPCLPADRLSFRNLLAPTQLWAAPPETCGTGYPGRQLQVFGAEAEDLPSVPQRVESHKRCEMRQLHILLFATQARTQSRSLRT